MTGKDVTPSSKSETKGGRSLEGILGVSACGTHIKP